MMDTFELARAIADGDFEQLCPTMELRECPSYREAVMRGCGLIRTNRRGELEFCISGNPPLPVPEVFRRDKPQGTLYGIEDHVLLVAVDAMGREWRSEPMLIHLEHPGELMYGHFSRPLESLVYFDKARGREEHAIRMYIPRQGPFPFDSDTMSERRAGQTLLAGTWSLDHHSRTIAGASVTFRQEESRWLSVTATHSEPLMPDWPGLMSHALAFATAGIVRPAAIERWCGDRRLIGVFSGPFRQLRSQMPRPISGLGGEHVEDFWTLVERLFCFLQREQPSAAHLIDELDAIRMGAAMSMRTASLTLAIGIESLANHLLPTVPASGWNEDARAALERHIRDWQGDPSTRGRALTWLCSKGTPRTVDRLYAWATESGISHSLIRDWSALRNSRAHGGRLNETQPTYDRYYAVVELFYRLIASAVGFDGRVIETSRRGWGCVPSMTYGTPSTEE